MNTIKMRRLLYHAVLLADKFTSSPLKILESDGFESHFYISPVVKETKSKLNQTRGGKMNEIT